ncbi:MAG: MarR family transcriptional regulator [Oligoflexia bacterium]|nr:MarR family transcriptional regulator [Oligoflexia bacterium]
MGTHYKGSADEKRALNAFICLSRSAETLSRVAEAHLAKAGMGMRQFAVLEALYHLGPLQQSEIAQKMLCTPGHITGLLDKLERAGLLRRRAKPGDRRVKAVELTERGRALVRKLLPGHVRAITSAASALSAAELSTLRLLCRKLGLALSLARAK